MTAFYLTLVCLVALFLLAVAWLVLEWGDKLPCWFGFHKWQRFMQASTSFQPQRVCARCLRVQGLFRGAGADDWQWLDE